MIYSDHFRFACSSCLNGHRQNKCTHFNKIANGTVFVIEDRGRKHTLRRTAKTKKNNLRLLNASLIDDNPLVNPLCSLTGKPAVLCADKRCPASACHSKDIRNIFIRTDSLLICESRKSKALSHLDAAKKGSKIQDILPSSVHGLMTCGLSYVGMISPFFLDSDVVTDLMGYIRALSFTKDEGKSNYSLNDDSINPKDVVRPEINPALMFFIKARVSLMRYAKIQERDLRDFDLFAYIIKTKSDSLIRDGDFVSLRSRNSTKFVDKWRISQWEEDLITMIDGIYQKSTKEKDILLTIFQDHERERNQTLGDSLKDYYRRSIPLFETGDLYKHKSNNRRTSSTSTVYELPPPASKLLSSNTSIIQPTPHIDITAENPPVLEDSISITPPEFDFGLDGLPNTDDSFFFGIDSEFPSTPKTVTNHWISLAEPTTVIDSHTSFVVPFISDEDDELLLRLDFSEQIIDPSLLEIETNSLEPGSCTHSDDQEVLHIVDDLFPTSTSV